MRVQIGVWIAYCCVIATQHTVGLSAEQAVPLVRTVALGYSGAHARHKPLRGRLRCAPSFFDFNGVVADDKTPHLQCFQQALAEQGIELSREDYYGTYLGTDERTCTAALLPAKSGVCNPLLHAGIIERKAMLLRAYTALHRPLLFPWVIGFIRRAAERYRLEMRPAGAGSKFFLHWKQARLRGPSN